MIDYAQGHPCNEELEPDVRDELERDARKYRAAAQALDLDVSRRVVDLESQRSDLAAQELEASRLVADLELVAEQGDSEAERQPTRFVVAEQRGRRRGLQTRLTEIDKQLKTLEAHEGHPDRWLAEHGGAFRDGLAAKHHLRRMRYAARHREARVRSRPSDLRRPLERVRPGVEPIRERSETELDYF